MVENQNDIQGLNDIRNRKVISGMFTDVDDAERAYEALHEQGYTKEEISIMMSEETKNRHFTGEHETEMGSKALEGTGVGSTIGGVIGVVTGIIAAIGTSIVIPGLGLTIAGPIAAGLAGAGAGSIAGGIVGALIGLGIPEENAKKYETGIKNGRIVISVKPHTEADVAFIEENWKKNKAEEIYH